MAFRRPLLTLFALAPFLSPSAHAQGASPDAVAVFEDVFLGATLTNACNPKFDWNRTQKGAQKIAQAAYDEMLAEVHRIAPGSNEAEEAKADQAFDLRQHQILRKGEEMVKAKGCDSPDIRTRVEAFAKRNWQ